MNIASYSRDALASQLAGEGVRFHAGPFVIDLRSSLPAVAAGLHQMYGEYPLADSDYADFYLSLQQTAGLRRLWRPQVKFSLDGHEPFKPLPLSQAFPMFEWALNWCIASHMHCYLIVHAAVVERDGCVAILPAPPGSGKSTLCAALVSRGWRLFSDELALISLHDGSVLPLPRPVGLKNDSIEIMRTYTPQAVIGPNYTDTRKGTVAHMKAPTTSIRRAAESARAAWVIFPKYRAGSEAVLTPRSQGQTALYLAQNAFNYSVLGRAGFETLTQVVDGCRCYDFEYSRLDDAIATFAALEPLHD